MRKRSPRTDLGPNQLEWCRQNIPNFRVAEEQLKRVLESQVKNREEMGLS